MKKSFFILALFAAMSGSLKAQDTLWMKPAPLGNYFYNNWIDTNANHYVSCEMFFGLATTIARQFITEDTLQIYGIAAMMVPEDFGFEAFWTPAELQYFREQNHPEDPTYNNCKESLMLFQFHGNIPPNNSASLEVMQQLGDSLEVHYQHTPVSHYIMTNGTPSSYIDTFAKPVYERYFVEPQTVHDTFYAGFSRSHMKFDTKDHLWHPQRPSFYCMAFDHMCEGALYLAYDEKIAAMHTDTTHSWWDFHNEYVGMAYYIFPILTPEPIVDTTGNGGDTIIVDTAIIDTTIVDTTIVNPGDTVGVVLPDFLGRYVSVSPNPARGSAQVLSSFGVTRVEVFGASGARVMDMTAAGLKATLDVSKLPAGTYLLRIHTPMGATVKKLTVSR